MIFTLHYEIEHDADVDLFVIHSEETPVCPRCGVVMAGHGTLRRHMIDEEGETHWLRLRRWRCPHCKTYHLELPGFLCPYKYYDANLIRDVQNGGGDWCPADDRTILRWKKEVSALAAPVNPANDTSVKEGKT